MELERALEDELEGELSLVAGPLTWPDLCDFRKRTPALCPDCLRSSRAEPLAYALNTDRYVCPLHGPVLAGEAIWRFIARG